MLRVHTLPGPLGRVRTLVGAGVTCRRGRSSDACHHVSYRLVDEVPDPDPIWPPVGEVVADLGETLPRSAGNWWARLRPHTVAPGAAGLRIDAFTVDVTLSGPDIRGTRMSNLIKSMLDGLVSCFHVHDGSHGDRLWPLATWLGPPAETWQWLTNPSAAILGVRPLVRPYRQGTFWNPADDRCRAFRIRSRPADHWSLRAQVRTFNDRSDRPMSPAQ
jgi:hypothetical protein